MIATVLLSVLFVIARFLDFVCNVVTEVQISTMKVCADCLHDEVVFGPIFSARGRLLPARAHGDVWFPMLLDLLTRVAGPALGYSGDDLVLELLGAAEAKQLVLQARTCSLAYANKQSMLEWYCGSKPRHWHFGPLRCVPSLQYVAPPHWTEQFMQSGIDCPGRNLWGP